MLPLTCFCWIKPFSVETRLVTTTFDPPDRALRAWNRALLGIPYTAIGLTTRLNLGMCLLKISWKEDQLERSWTERKLNWKEAEVKYKYKYVLCTCTCIRHGWKR